MAFSRSQSFSFQGGVVLERFVFLRTLLLSKVLLGIFHLISQGRHSDNHRKVPKT